MHNFIQKQRATMRQQASSEIIKKNKSETVRQRIY